MERHSTSLYPPVRCLVVYQAGSHVRGGLISYQYVWYRGFDRILGLDFMRAVVIPVVRHLTAFDSQAMASF